MSDALDFLRRWEPGGPWTLTVIYPDRKQIETRSFAADTENDLEEWLSQHDGQGNLYFAANPVPGDTRKKAAREDVIAMKWLHVDIDPRTGEDLEAEQSRILALTNNPPESVPPPTVVVYSGGGYQLFWKLAEPVILGGDIAACEEAARYNRQLEVLYGGDNCFNVDRICRLPGTMNVPDAKKRAKGRRLVRAALLEFHDSRVYPITDFIPAPVRQLAGAAAEGVGSFAPQVADVGNVARLASVDDLPEGVSERVKVVIVQGADPDSPNRFPSRSEWLFYVVCELVRAGTDDTVIYSVITDPDFAISASVVDKGQRMQAYALHQITRAKEHADNPWLMKLNERHAVIGNMGGKCRVIEETYDPGMKRTRISKQSFEDFRNRYMNKFVQSGTDRKGNPALKPLGNWWLSNERRKQYDYLVFSPEREVPGAYNLWRGFAYDAKPGTCDLYLTHMFENICSGNQEHFDYLFAWMASAVQFPAKPGETAVILRGREGTGKTFFAKKFGALFGRHFLAISDAKHLVESFNQHLRDCVVLLADEAFYAGDKKHESKLKQLVTDDMIMYEPKGVDAESGPNYLHIIMSSNSAWVVPAGPEARRFFVLDVCDTQMQKRSYFEAIAKQMEAGGYEALLHMLRTFPLDNVHIATAPKTAALVDQKVYSLSQEDSWWAEKLIDGTIFPLQEAWACEVSREDLFNNYVAYMQKMRRNFVSTPLALGRYLGRVAPGCHQARRKMPIDDGWGNKVEREIVVYRLPPLEDCRRAWESNFGSAMGWPMSAPAPIPPEMADSVREPSGGMGAGADNA